MVVDGEGYLALIEYLVESLGLFEQKGDEAGGETIEHLVSDQVAESLIALCEQNPQLDSKVRFVIMREADSVVADLQEVLSAVWERPATAAQREFLIEFIILIKNLFDSAIR
ncbi:DUF3802 family protein [Aeromonas schubertii]|uniref:DUF3802 family protein n=1 Tax=Aeromonas schubertii TaxID=652 RepID=A0A0S2SL44_9GAMM|nr:DUF3802 family protein [Aeromonas schubertii]ALP42451.1 hypothetical protein WL1483_3032 [Aeromonas schubertii]KUE81552.1 topoisomerase II [Aeromonas schubertii]MBZ6064891.1 DUF3802 family protein [Aeromonas schubertii]MBZ6071783.1 DUF3802 family protein [Aeromonas schubertii]QCG48522.1 DUF3802 family protein [Aeromonas schubertii]